MFYSLDVLDSRFVCLASGLEGGNLAVDEVKGRTHLNEMEDLPRVLTPYSRRPWHLLDLHMNFRIEYTKE